MYFPHETDKIPSIFWSEVDEREKSLGAQTSSESLLQSEMMTKPRATFKSVV